MNRKTFSLRAYDHHKKPWKNKKFDHTHSLVQDPFRLFDEESDAKDHGKVMLLSTAKEHINFGHV